MAEMDTLAAERVRETSVKYIESRNLGIALLEAGQKAAFCRVHNKI